MGIVKHFESSDSSPYSMGVLEKTMQENANLKKRVAKLEAELEALNERVEKLYLTGKSF